MLSSAKKSVPTTKQFRQPYFMHIAPDGAIMTACSRFTALLKKRNILDFQGKNLLDVFSRLGAIHPEYSSLFNGNSLPKTLDLFIQGPRKKSLVIRWIPTPQYGMEMENGGWQFTGVKIYSDTSPVSE